MTGHYDREYQAKQISAEKAAGLVKSGDYVEYGYCLSKPVAIDMALGKRKAELSDVKVHCSNTLTKFICRRCRSRGEHFTYSSGHCSVSERPMMGTFGFYVPSSFGQNPEWFRRQYRPVDIIMIQTCPMDKHGYFNFGPTATFLAACCEVAKTVIVEINKNIPRALGGREEAIHISKVDHIVEAPEANIDYFEVEISAHHGHRYEDRPAYRLGTRRRHLLQLGIGGMPNAVGQLIAKSDLKDLGIHTELLCDTMLELYRPGRLRG